MANLGIQNNNPGNLRDPATGSFKVFSSPEEGHQALVDDITLKQSGKSSHIKPGASIEDLGNIWAPPTDNNKKGDWAKNVASFLGVPTAYAFDQVPPEKLAEGIKVAEGTTAIKSNGTKEISQTSKQLTHDQLIANINAMEKQGAKPQEIQGYLDSLKNNQDNSTKSTPQNFDEYLKQNPNGKNPTSDLNAGNPITPGNTTIGNAIADFTPGTKLAQGAGYALAQGLGSQKGLVDANNEGIDIEGQLLKQIKTNKAKGKDTTRLEKALKELIPNLQSQANQVSDVGTGGIKNSDVIKSAGALATLPLAGYLGNALRGGGLLGESSGLTSFGGGEGLLGSSSALSKEAQIAAKVIKDPEIQTILKSVLGKGETMADLSRQDALKVLGNKLNELPITENGGALEQKILKSIEALKPTMIEKQSLVTKLAKNGYNIGKNIALTKLLGDTVGGFIHQNTK